MKLEKLRYWYRLQSAAGGFGFLIIWYLIGLKSSMSFHHLYWNISICMKWLINIMVDIQGTTCRYIICIIHKSSSLEIWFWNSVLIDNLLVYTNTWTTFLTQLSSNVKHHCISALNLTKNSYYVCMYMDEMCSYVNQRTTLVCHDWETSRD